MWDEHSAFAALEPQEGPHGAIQERQDTRRIIWAACFPLEVSGGLDSPRRLLGRIWTRTVCAGKRKGPWPGSEVVEVGQPSL